LWKERSKNRANWQKTVKEEKVLIGLQCHLGGRRKKKEKEEEGEEENEEEEEEEIYTNTAVFM